MRIYLKTSKHFTPEDLEGVTVGAVLEFDMPPFCSGDYSTKVKEDELGLYVNSKKCYFSGCRDYYFRKSITNTGSLNKKPEIEQMFLP